jgi:hypothetical protein
LIVKLRRDAVSCSARAANRGRGDEIIKAGLLADLPPLKRAPLKQIAAEAVLPAFGMGLALPRRNRFLCVIAT